MRRIGLVLLALNLAAVCQFLPSASAANYTPGVGAGDYVKFGVSESYNSNDPSLQTKPQFLADVDNTGSFRAEVETVSGTSVIYKMTQSFNNGTMDKVMNLMEDVNTGAGNATLGGFHYVIVASGLGIGDRVANNATAPIINETMALTYAGACRDNNLYHTSGSIDANHSLTGDQSWDKSSGIMTELSVSVTEKSGPSGQYTTNWQELLTATETNIWSYSANGCSNITLLVIIVATGTISVVGGIVAFRKMNKTRARVEATPSHTAQSSDSSNFSTLIQCGHCNGYNLPGSSSCGHCGMKL